MLKDCFECFADDKVLKAYLVAQRGILYYEEECFFGDGAVYGYKDHVYIEAFCAEEAKNLFRALTLKEDYMESKDCSIDSIECLGIYTDELGEPLFAYISIRERPKEYQRHLRHIGKIQDLFAITERQWRAIENLSEATKSKFLGITKKEATEFITEKVKEVSKWKKAHTGRRNYKYNRPRYNPDDQAEWENDCCISWLDLCGDM